MAEDADLMSIGRHCCVEFCGQVDFLPFVCDCCKKTYCLEHRSYTAHACTKANGRTTEVIVCPMCAKAVKLVPDEDVNATFERHALTACDPSNYSKVHKKPKCPARGCREKLTTINGYTCKSCGTRVCLKHRLADDHQCQAQQGRPLAAAAGRQNGGVAGTSMLANWFSSSSSAVASTAKPATSAASLAAQRRQQQQRPDPSNTVMGSAARRRQQANPAPAPTRTPAAAGREVCPQCGASFASVADLIQHAEDYHPAAGAAAASPAAGARGGYVCSKCGQGFADAVQLVQHDERQHSSSAQTKRSECVVS